MNYDNWKATEPTEWDTDKPRETACDGSSDDCDGDAVCAVDTSDGHLPKENLCGPCAAAWKKRCEDGPDDSYRGEPIDYAFQCEEARRVK